MNSLNLTLPRKQMPWLSLRALLGKSAAAAKARTCRSKEIRIHCCRPRRAASVQAMLCSSPSLQKQTASNAAPSCLWLGEVAEGEQRAS